MTEIAEGQVSMFDAGLPYGRTCQVPIRQTKDRISDPPLNPSQM